MADLWSYCIFVAKSCLKIKSNMGFSPQKIVRFYIEGFKQMTWGRTLWLIIAIKLFVMFAILKVFFFQPTVKGTPDEKQQQVGNNLVE